MQKDSGRWDGIVFDTALQTKLIDEQVKFAKVSAEAFGWRFNQLTDTINVISISENEGNVFIENEAQIDMLAT